MISFKSYLTEARLAPLYHAAHISVIIQIIEDGYFKPKTKQLARKLLMDTSKKITKDNRGDIIKGISTTRNVRFARKWSDGCYMELDQQELAQRYKIVPLQFWQGLGFDGSGTTTDPITGKYDYSKAKPVQPARAKGEKNTDNEFEEFIITSNPIPIRVVKAVWVPFWKQDFTEVKELRSVIDKHNVPIEIKLYKTT